MPSCPQVTRTNSRRGSPRTSRPAPPKSRYRPSDAARIRSRIWRTAGRCWVESREGDLVRELFARLSDREFEAMAELLDDDVEFDLAYAPAFLPMPTRGRQAVSDLVGNVIGGMFEPFRVEVGPVSPGRGP